MSLRPGTDRGAKVLAWARQHRFETIGTALNALVDTALEITPKDILAHAEAKAAHLGLTHARDHVDKRRRWAFRDHAG